MEDKIKEGLAEKGFNEEEFNNWLDGMETSWDELMERQEMEKIALVQENVGEAADKAFAFLDGILAEARAEEAEGKFDGMDKLQE